MANAKPKVALPEVKKENPAKYQTATRGLFTEVDLDTAISEVYSKLAGGDANYDQARLLLSAIGKKLNLENLKVRAGVYRSGRPGFFLGAEQPKAKATQ